jgi:hypothetical protein
MKGEKQHEEGRYGDCTVFVGSNYILYRSNPVLFTGRHADN